MRLRVICIAILHAAMVKSLKEVSGYLGDNVTLPSGADPSWNLSKIEWSVFSNSTWIATYRKGKENIERFYQYKGRLSLDTSTGDLTIHNLSRQDAMDYSVDLDNTAGLDSANKVKLTVKERLQKPTIETAIFGPTNESCLVVLLCSSTDQGVEFTWQVKPTDVTVFNTQDRHGSAAVHMAFLNTTQSGVEFTCTSNRRKENSSHSVFPQCSVPVKPCPTPAAVIPSPERCRTGLTVFCGIVLGCILSVLVKCIFGDQIKKAWEFIKEKLRPSNNLAEIEA